MEIDNIWEFFGIIMILLIVFIIGGMYGDVQATDKMVEITEKYYGNVTKEYFLALLK